jgi:hypothetical protein
MATVYRSHHPGFGIPVAVKVIAPELARDASFRARFRLEAQAVARLRHPNILQVYDAGEDDGVAYLVSQLVDGGSLADRLGVPLPLPFVNHVATQVASALDYAHEQGVLHRDIKPANILLTRDDEPILADFGLARVAECRSDQVDAGLALGSAEYMSPEQASGRSGDARADLYSFAVVLYEMLTGAPPYRYGTATRTILAHTYDPLPSPRMANPNLSGQIERVLLKALAKDAGQRYPSAGELAGALKAASIVPVSGPPSVRWPQTAAEPFPVFVPPAISEIPTDPSLRQRAPVDETAVEAVLRLFQSQNPVGADGTFSQGAFSGSVANQMDLDEATLLRDLQAVQIENGLLPDGQLEPIEELIETASGPRVLRFANLSLELPSAADRPAIYARVAVELHRRYGLRKFIVVVPSLAARASVLKALKTMQLAGPRGGGELPYRYAAYDSTNPASVRQFARSSGLEILVMTIDSFSKESNRIHESSQRLHGEKPIQLIQATRPVLLLDEPQSFETEPRIRALANLDPLFALRFGSEHRNPYNLIYESGSGERSVSGATGRFSPTNPGVSLSGLRANPASGPLSLTGAEDLPSTPALRERPGRWGRRLWWLAATLPLALSILVGGRIIAGQLGIAGLRVGIPVGDAPVAVTNAPVVAANAPVAAANAPAAAVPVASAEPILVVIAPFDDSFATRRINVGQRIGDVLLQDLRKQNLRHVELMPLPGGDSAAPKLKALEATRDLPAKAVLLVWGWYDEDRVSPHVVLLRGYYDPGAGAFPGADAPFALRDSGDEVLNRQMPSAVSEQVVRLVKLIQ